MAKRQTCVVAGWITWPKHESRLHDPKALPSCEGKRNAS